jgi:membrane protein implicated in regulation of membrane protease activity
MVALIIWLVLAVVLGVAEMLTVTLTLGLIAVAAAAAAIIAGVSLPVPVQILAFIVVSVAGFGVVRPIAKRHLKQPPALRTGTAALVGRSALVLSQTDGHGGRVRIGGEEWSSRSYDETLVIPVGATVDVIQIEGVTALVYPRE